MVKSTKLYTNFVETVDAIYISYNLLNILAVTNTMRIWSLHPKYLDSQGLVALWRETLLARAVLQGATRGYRNHPQLERFKEQLDPLVSIESYLLDIYEHACQRGYNFNENKVRKNSPRANTIFVTTKQLQYEWQHLLKKLRSRSPKVWAQWCDVKQPECHPLFQLTEGEIALWERV